MSLNRPIGETAFQLSTTVSSKDEKKKEKPNLLLPVRRRIKSWRWLIVMVTWFGFINQQLMSSAFTMAIVCMTGSEPRSDIHVNISATSTNTSSNSSIAQQSTQEGEFHWDEATQGVLLSANLYASFLAPAISGFLARRFGSKMIVGITVTCRSVLFLLTPLCARTHLYLLIAVRVVGGVITNTLTPCAQGLWAHWAPDQEKVHIVAWSKSGVNIGILLASLISGFLCTIPLDNGWPFVFYVFGGLSAVWCVLWWVMVQDSPEKHRWVKETERQYIRENVKAKPDKITKIPYQSILTSRPVFAYFVIQTVHKWCASIYLAYLPKYMRDVLRFEIEENAVVSSLPFASRFLGVVFWEHLVDVLASRNISTTTNRKIVQSAGFVACAALTTATGFVTADNRLLAVALFVINMFFQSCTFASVAVLPLDMSPRHAGIICGIFQSAGNVVTMFGPMTVGFLTPGGTLEQWRSVFYMITAVYLFGVTVFIVFGSAKLQPWDADSTAIQTPGSESKEGEKGHDMEIPLPNSLPILITGSSCQSPDQAQPPTSLRVKQASCGCWLSEDSDGGNINASFVVDERISTGKSSGSFVNDVSLSSVKNNAFPLYAGPASVGQNTYSSTISRRNMKGAWGLPSNQISVTCVSDGRVYSVLSEHISSGQNSVSFYLNDDNISEFDTCTNFLIGDRISCGQILRTADSWVNGDISRNNFNSACTPDCKTDKRFSIICHDSNVFRNENGVIDSETVAKTVELGILNIANELSEEMDSSCLERDCHIFKFCKKHNEKNDDLFVSVKDEFTRL